MQDPLPLDEKTPAKRREFGLRALMLGALYALAVIFAVAFSPSVGISPAQPGNNADSLAASPVPSAR